MALHSYSQTSCHQVKVVVQWHGAWAPCPHTACPAFKSPLFQEFVAHHGTGVHIISTKGKVNDCKHFLIASVATQQRQVCQAEGPSRQLAKHVLCSFVSTDYANVFKECSRVKLVGAKFAQMLLNLLIRVLSLKISWNWWVKPKLTLGSLHIKETTTGLNVCMSMKHGNSALSAWSHYSQDGGFTMLNMWRAPGEAWATILPWVFRLRENESSFMAFDFCTCISFCLQRRHSLAVNSCLPTPVTCSITKGE